MRKLASLLQSEDIPIRSVRVLEQGFEQKVLKEDESAYELLGNSRILAREADKAEPALEKAAELSPEGDLFVRLGQVRLLKEDYDGAKAALKRGLDKGGNRRSGRRPSSCSASPTTTPERSARRALVREVAPLGKIAPDVGRLAQAHRRRAPEAEQRVAGSVGL